MLTIFVVNEIASETSRLAVFRNQLLISYAYATTALVFALSHPGAQMFALQFFKHLFARTRSGGLFNNDTVCIYPVTFRPLTNIL